MQCSQDCCSFRLSVVGSFPKPASLTRRNKRALEVLDWFQAPDTAASFVPPEQDVAGMFNEQEFENATRDVLKRQAALDVITDGEIRRDNYIYGFLRKLDGVDFSLAGRTAKSCRQGAYVAELPTIVDKLRPRDGVPRLAETEWKPAQMSSDQTVHLPIKFAIPGPLTCSDTIADKYYGPKFGAEEGRVHMMADLAPLIRTEIDALVSAGCKHIQIDEPLLARYPQYAETVLPIVDSLVEGAAAAGCTIYIHMCCGYPDKVDSTTYLKAPKENYAKLAPLIESLCPNVHVVSIEDAHRHNDFEVLLPLFKTKTVMLGVIKVASSKIETAEEIEARVREALQFIPPSRLILAPDCGLAMLPDDTIDAKLRSLVAATRVLRATRFDSTSEMP